MKLIECWIREKLLLAVYNIYGHQSRTSQKYAPFSSLLKHYIVLLKWITILFVKIFKYLYYFAFGQFLSLFYDPLKYLHCKSFANRLNFLKLLKSTYYTFTFEAALALDRTFNTGPTFSNEFSLICWSAWLICAV